VRWDRTATIGMTLAFVACGGAEMSASDRSLAPSDVDDTIATPTASETDVDTAPPDTGEPVEPAWWSVDAELVVADAAIQADESTWRVTLWGEEETLLPCTFDVPIASATVEDVPSVEAGTLVTWWGIELDEGPEVEGCPSWPAADVYVGLGPYDGRLDSAIDAHEWLGLDLYGLYMQLAPADPVLVVGVAGTEAQFDGVGGVVVGAPLPDGIYAATTLVLLAL